MSLTTANSVIVLTFAGLFDSGVPLQGFSADDVFDTADISNAETSMGVDGKLSYGWKPAATVQTFSLQADSLSNLLFDQVIAAEKANREKLRADGIITLTGLGQTYQMVNGVLTTFTPMAGAKVMAQPRKFVITWETYKQGPV